MADAKVKKNVTGCLFVILKLFTTDAMWLWLLHSILTRIEASTIEWYVFWTYVPVSVLIGVSCSMFRVLTEDD